MKRVILLLSLASALAVGVAGPVTAAERDVRIVQLIPGFRQNLVDYTRATYDAETRQLRVYFTTHCFIQTVQYDPDIPPVSGASSVAWIDWWVTQRGTVISENLDTNLHATLTGWDTPWQECHRDWVLTVEGVSYGSATIDFEVAQAALNFVFTETKLRVVIPAR